MIVVVVAIDGLVFDIRKDRGPAASWPLLLGVRGLMAGVIGVVKFLVATIPTRRVVKHGPGADGELLRKVGVGCGEMVDFFFVVVTVGSGINFGNCSVDLGVNQECEVIGGVCCVMGSYERGQYCLQYDAQKFFFVVLESLTMWCL